MTYVRQEYDVSERQACAMFGISRSVQRYTPHPRDDQAIIDVLLTLAHRHPELGFGQLYKRIRRQGHRWNHKRIYRVYCALKLNKRRRGKKRLPARHPEPLAVSQAVNACWSADFMSDALWNGRRFRTFNVVDDFNREALAIEIDFSLPATRVIRVLDRLAAWRGYPAKLRLDNGPEFVAVEMADWAEEHGVALEFIKPGRPMQNGFVERFNRTYREAVLDMYVFNSLDEVRHHTEQWLKEYNEDRPHESLGNLTPREYLFRHHPEVSSLGWY